MTVKIYKLDLIKKLFTKISQSLEQGIGQVLFLVEIIEASGFNQQQARLASLYLSSSPSGVRA